MNTKNDFESSLKRLEEIADTLEAGNLSLEDSVKLFEEGVKLSKFCEKKLADTEQKIEEVNSFEYIETTEDAPKPQKHKKEKPSQKVQEAETGETEDTFLF